MASKKHFISRQQVQATLGVDQEFLLELEREEIIFGEEAGGYAASTVERIRVCQTIHDELGVNLAGLEVALNLLDTIQSERRQFQEALDWLKKNVPRE
jgi:hypothetical protein